METGVIQIGWGQLVFGFAFVLAAGVTSLYHALKLERDLIVGAVRTFIQLFILGYVLKYVFNLDNLWLVLALFCVMTLFAAWTVRGRVRERRISFFWPILVSMILSYALVSFVVTEVVIGVAPWWRPRYFIPLSGMVIGNSMNAIAVALERLLSELKGRRAVVEMMLCHGADYKEASRDIVGNAMRAGMIPSINSMMAAGVVFIPGMMTGQILAGADPLMAVRYQIMVMVMLVGSTAIGSLLVVLLVRKRCFGPGQRLLLGTGQGNV
jgi:putative ABC transport system permease protein